jgi:hypothetical protein
LANPNVSTATARSYNRASLAAVDRFITMLQDMNSPEKNLLMAKTASLKILNTKTLLIRELKIR